MQEIELYSKLNDPLQAIDRIGEFFARSGMFGCDRAEQGKVLAMVCLAERKSPVVINRTYDIVEGKLRKKALAALAEFRARGGKHKWVKSGDDAAEKEDDRMAVLELTPTDGPPITYRYSIADARAEGLLRDKSRWTKRPGNMLRARCISNALGMVCPEIYAGDDEESEPAQAHEINLTAAKEPAKAEVVTVEATPVETPTVTPPPPQQPPTVATAEFKAGPSYAASVGPKLPQALIDQVEQAIGEHVRNAVDWMKRQDPPWVLPGQGLESLTESRAKRIIKQRDGFIKAITPTPTEAK